MRHTLILISLLAGSAASWAQEGDPIPGPPVDVNVVNETLSVDVPEGVQLIGPMFTPAELRSIAGVLDAPAGGGAQQVDVQFNDSVVIREFTFVTVELPSSSSGVGPPCSVAVSFNGALAKVLGWEPPGVIYREWKGKDWAGIDQPPTATPKTIGLLQSRAGTTLEWRPPVAIDVTPNDTISLTLTPTEKGQVTGACQVEYLVLGTTANGN